MYVSKALLYFDYTLIFMLTLCIFILTVNLFKQRLLTKSLQSKISNQGVLVSTLEAKISTKESEPAKTVVIVISYLEQKTYLYDLLQYVGITLDDKQKGLLERKAQGKISAGFRGGDNG